MIAALVGLGVDIRDAEIIAQESLSDVIDVAIGGVEAAVQAAGDPHSGADEASGTHYKHTVGPTETALHDAMMAYWGDPEVADRFAPEAAPLAASSMAEFVGNAVAASFVATPAGTFARLYYISDHLGSIRTVVTASGNVIESRDYYPHGLMMPGRTSTTGTPAREGYTGHELDAETGMDYAGARYYMPALGRWTAVDPLAEQFQAWNPYNYVMGNPVFLIDPDGAKPLPSECCVLAVSVSTRAGIQKVFGVTISASVGIVMDGNGNVGLYTTKGIGGSFGTPSAIAGFNLYFNSDISSIDEFYGTSFNYGVAHAKIIGADWQGNASLSDAMDVVFAFLGGDVQPEHIGIESGTFGIGFGWLGYGEIEWTTEHRRTTTDAIKTLKIL